MANIVIPFAAVSHQPVPSAGFNNNFTEVATKFNAFAVQTDVAKVITVAHTFTVPQLLAGAAISGDLLFTDGLYDIGKAGASRPRQGYFSGDLTAFDIILTNSGRAIFLSGATTGVAYGNAVSTGANLVWGIERSIGAGIFTGAPAYASVFGTQNATDLSFGTNIVERMRITSGGILLLNTGISTSAAIGDMVLRNAGGLRGVNAAGTDTIGLILLTSGNKVNVDPGGQGALFGGAITFSVSASKIIPGVTSLSLRNNADSADNVLVTDIGNVTIRAGLTAGASIVAPISPTAGSFHATPTASDPAISTSDGDIWVMTTGALKVKLNGSVRTMWHSGMVSTGYAAWTGTLNRATVLDQSTATLAQVAQRLAGLQNDLMTAGVLST